MRAALLALLLPAAVPAQESPNPYDRAALQVRGAQLQLEIARTRDERQRLEQRLRDLQAEIDRLALQRERLNSDEARLRDELLRLQAQTR